MGLSSFSTAGQWALRAKDRDRWPDLVQGPLRGSLGQEPVKEKREGWWTPRLRPPRSAGQTFPGIPLSVTFGVSHLFVFQIFRICWKRRRWGN